MYIYICVYIYICIYIYAVHVDLKVEDIKLVPPHPGNPGWPHLAGTGST